MDDEGWISDYINSPVEWLHSFKFPCCGFVCLHRSGQQQPTLYSLLTCGNKAALLQLQGQQQRYLKQWQITAPYAHAHSLSKSEIIGSGEQSYSDFCDWKIFFPELEFCHCFSLSHLLHKRVAFEEVFCSIFLKDSCDLGLQFLKNKIP